MKNRHVVLFFAALAVVLACVPSAMAYGQQIEGAINSSATWIIRVLGGGTMLFGIVFGAMRLQMHDREGLKYIGYAVTGGLVAFLAPKIVDLTRSWTGF